MKISPPIHMHKPNFFIILLSFYKMGRRAAARRTASLTWSISSRFKFISLFLILVDAQSGDHQIAPQGHLRLLQHAFGAADLKAVNDH